MRQIFNWEWGGDPPHFAGRAAELQAVLDALERGRAPLVVGRRGVGKTCLIRKVESVLQEKGWLIQPRPRALPRHLTMTAVEAACVLIEAATTYATKTRTERQESSAIGFRTETEPEHAEQEEPSSVLAPFAALTPLELKEHLSQMGTGELGTQMARLLAHVVGPGGQQGVRGLVVILDEFQMFAGSQQTRPIDMLVSAIAQCRELKVACRFILAGMPLAKSVVSASLGGAVDLVRIIEIGHLTNAEAAEAMQRPLEAASLTFQPDLVDQIVKDTAGHPKLVQFYAQGILDFCPEGSTYSLAQYRHVSHRIEAAFYGETYPDIESLPDVQLDVLWATARALEKKAAEEHTSPELALVSPKEIRQFVEMERTGLQHYLDTLMSPGAEFIYKASRARYGILKPLLWKRLLQMRGDQALGDAFEGRTELAIPAESLADETRAMIALKNFIHDATRNSQQVWIIDEYWRADCVRDYLHLVDSHADIYLATRFERRHPDGKKVFEELRKLRAARAGRVLIANLEGPSSAFPVKGRYIIIGDSIGIESSQSFASLGNRVCTIGRMTPSQVRVILEEVEDLIPRMEEIPQKGESAT